MTTYSPANRANRTAGTSNQLPHINNNTTPTSLVPRAVDPSPHYRKLITNELKKGLFGFAITFTCMAATAAWGYLTPIPTHPYGMRDPGWNLPTGLCVLWMATGWSYFFLCLHRAAALHPSVRRSRYRSTHRNPLNPEPKHHPYDKNAIEDHTNMNKQSTSKPRITSNTTTY